MDIEINGEVRTLPDDCTVAGLVRELGYDGRRLAVEVNGEIVPGANRSDRCLTASDRVEIVHAIGGG